MPDAAVQESRHAAFLLGLTLFYSVFLGMPMLLLGCFDGLSITIPMQAAAVLLPLQIMSALLSRRPLWSFSVVLNLAFVVAYTGWISTRSFPTVEPVQPIYLFYILSGMQMFVLVAILHQLLGTTDAKPHQRFLLPPSSGFVSNGKSSGKLNFTLYWVTLYLLSALLIAESIVAAVEPEMNLHLLLFFTHVWPYIGIILPLKQLASLRAIEWLGVFLIVWQILHSLVLIAFELGPLWARMLCAVGFAAAQIVLSSMLLYFSSTRLEQLSPKERLQILLHQFETH